MVAGRSRALILADLGAGISIAGLLIPEAIAYSSIAELPASFGITAAIVGPLSYSLIGRSRVAIVSATSGAAALLAAGLSNAAVTNASRTDCAVALASLVGVFFLLGSALRIASLTSFISRPVLHGFAFGLALTISIRQLPSLLGLRAPGATPWQTLYSVLAYADRIHLPSLLLGVAALLLLGIARRLRFAFGGLLVVGASLIVMRLAPDGHWGIATAGTLTFESSSFHLPALAPEAWLRLAQFAFPIAIVILAESWTTIRALAASSGDQVSAEREITALGFANLASALLRGLPVGAGFSIGNASAQAGTHSRFGAIFAALSVGVAAFAAADWVALIPEPMLAAIVISALAHALSLQPILSLFQIDRDQWIAITAALGVLVLGIINGLLLAVGLSLFLLLRRLAYPSLSELGRTGSHDFVDCVAHPEAKSVPGVLVIRPNAPLFFGNADAVLGEIAKRACAKRASSIVLSLEESDDLDSSALHSISDFIETMTAQGRSVVLARVHDRVRAVLARGGLVEFAEKGTFSVDDAVRAATMGAGSSGLTPQPPRSS